MSMPSWEGLLDKHVPESFKERVRLEIEEVNRYCAETMASYSNRTTASMEVTPMVATDTWPYTVELISTDDLMIDLTYQRPPLTPFVDKLIKEFDETLVGTLDVSARKDGTHAILDGAQRFSALQKFKTTAWCAIYTGMSIREEAMFFYNKNKNRRSVHPYYKFRALIVTGDKASIAINNIVEAESYKLGIGAGQDNVITAINAVQDSYAWSSLARTESLSPSLRVIRKAFYGRKGGKEGELIRGFAKFFQNFSDDEIDYDLLIELMAGQNPQNLLGRAIDAATVSRQPRAYHLAQTILETYNRAKPRKGKLSSRMIEARR